MKKYTSILLLLFASINQIYNMNEYSGTRSRIYILKYLSARQTVKRLLNSIENDEIACDKDTQIGNSRDDDDTLIITASKKDWNSLRKLIKKLDKPQLIRNN